MLLGFPSGMLLGLTIRDVVLIDRLSLVLRPGLCVLTGVDARPEEDKGSWISRTFGSIF